MTDAAPANATLAPFSHPVFRAVWIATLASNFGGLIQSVGASWMMATIAGSAGMVTLVQASTTLPIMLFSLAAGALADNFDRRRMMLTAQVFMFAVSTALAVAAYAGLSSPWALLGFTFLIGCGAAFNGPAWQSSVGEMVPRTHLAAAVSLNSMGFNIARSVGPALGGLIVASAGPAAAFALNATTYVGLVVVLIRWRPPARERTLPPERLGTAMAAGLRYAAMSPDLLAVILRAVLFGMAASGVTALMPLIARELVGGGARTYGLLLGAFGIGAVGGAAIGARIRRTLSTEAVARAAFLLFATAAVAVAVSTVLPLTLAALLVGGGAWVVALSTFNVTVQMSVPRWVVGRALSLYQMATFGGIAAGSWLWGALAERHGIETALLASAALGIVGLAVGLRWPLPVQPSDDLAPLRDWTEPRTVVPVEPRSGPIVVTLDYRIAPQDVRDFLAVMADRRRIRRRDGARHWTLLRDLADPELWVERYHSPTWTDYVRQNQRPTQADAAVSERLHALHRGPDPIRVHRLIERQTGSLPATASSPAPATPMPEPAQQS